MENYGMISTKGSIKVQKIIDKVCKLPITTSDKEIYAFLTVEFDKLEAEGHREVWDTDVREGVIGTIEEAINKSLTIYF